MKKTRFVAIALSLGLLFAAGAGTASAEWHFESIGTGTVQLNLADDGEATVELLTCDDGKTATWKKTELTYSIKNNGLLDLGTTRAVRAGVETWNEAKAPYKLKEVKGKADIEIEVVTAFGLTKLAGANVECAKGAKGITHVDIKIGTLTLLPITIQNIAAHEVGHALGLDHSTVGGGRTDLMTEDFGLLSGLLTEFCPSSLDIAALNAKAGSYTMPSSKWSAPKNC